jgi:hypothetical protein
MTVRSRFVHALATLVVVACGSTDRDAQPDAGATGGGPASGGSAGMPSGGAAGTGTGGSVTTVECNALVEKKPRIEINPSAPKSLGVPWAMPTSADGQQITIFSPDQASGGVQLDHITFSPWASWPSDGTAGPVHSALSGTYGLLGAIASASSPDHFAAAGFDSGQPTLWPRLLASIASSPRPLRARPT